MEANELRINNLVYYIKETVIVNAIHQTNNGLNVLAGHFYGDGSKAGSTLEFVKDLNPIPLTEEWLLKFGAVKNEHTVHGKVVRVYYSFGDYLYFVNYTDIDDKLTCYVGAGNGDTAVDIQYVHQLQNLYFALTGSELAIKN